MWPWILNIVRNAGPAAIGYFVNDVATFVNKQLPPKAQTATKSGTAWWFITIIMIAMAAVLFFVIRALMPRGKKGRGMFMIVAVGAAACHILDNYFGLDGVNLVMATGLVTLTTGAGVITTANLAFLPERIAFAAATQLTGVKISVQGDGVVFDSDANGITHVGVNRVLGQVTNNYVLTLANSLIPAKNVLFEFTNSAAQTPIVYYDSDSKPIQGIPPLFLQMAKAPILVGGNDFFDFATLSLPSLAAGDSITILYSDGTIQANMNRADLQYKLGYTQNIVNTPIYQIDNYNRSIKQVTVTALAAQTAYVQKWTPSVKGSMAGGEV
jgi:hypothetical protein